MTKGGPFVSPVPLVRQHRRKLYFVDGAVRNAALQRGISPLSNPEEMGLLAKNMAAGHLYYSGMEDMHLNPKR